jgi:Protein of unknown function (DUF3592)
MSNLFAVDAASLSTVVALLVIAAVVASLAMRALKARAVRRATIAWQETPGTVLMSTIQVRRNGASRHEIPTIVYSYQVNGTTLQGSRVRIGDELGRVRVAGTESSAAQTVARYPVGAAVKVLFDPRNPAESALER